MPKDEFSGTWTNLAGDEVELRYLMQPAVVTARRLSQATWEVKGEWHGPFYVDDDTFQKEFIEI